MNGWCSRRESNAHPNTTKGRIPAFWNHLKPANWRRFPTCNAPAVGSNPQYTLTGSLFKLSKYQSWETSVKWWLRRSLIAEGSYHFALLLGDVQAEASERLHSTILSTLSSSIIDCLGWPFPICELQTLLATKNNKVLAHQQNRFKEFNRRILLVGLI